MSDDPCMKTHTRIVLDTNIIFAGLYSANGASHLLLRTILDGEIGLVLSTPLLFEYEDVLKRHQSALDLTDAEIDLVLDQLCAMADFQSVYFLWRPCLPDAQDDMVLELAVASQVSRIVTFNAKDFAPAYQFGIQVLSPRMLLEELS